MESTDLCDISYSLLQNPGQAEASTQLNTSRQIVATAAFTHTCSLPPEFTPLEVIYNPTLGCRKPAHRFKAATIDTIILKWASVPECVRHQKKPIRIQTETKQN